MLFYFIYEKLFLLVGILSLFNLLVLLVGYAFTAIKKTKYTKSFEPKISVLIPTFNEERVIAKCLGSVFSSNYNPEKMEVICADDGSTDKTTSIIRSFIKKHKNLKLFKFGHGGKAATLNKAVKKASYDLIIAIDADMIINKEAIKNIVLPMRNTEVGSTFAKIDVILENRLNIIEYFQGVEFFYMNLVRIACSSLFSYPMWFSGQFVCYRLSTLKKVGYFSSDLLIEDFDISLKIFSEGYKSVYVKSAVGNTHPMNTVLKLIRQRMRWFYGGIQTLIKNKTLLNSDSLGTLYIFFSYIIWLLNSFIVFPGILYTIFQSFHFGIIPSSLFIITNNTFIATIKFWITLLGYQPLDLIYFTYGTIGTLLFTLYSLSLFFIGKRINIQIFVAFFSIFIYILFLQGCTILSIIYYPLSQVKSFRNGHLL